MIKFRSEGDGGTLFGLGLSFENLDRLREGLPIKFNGEQLGIKGEFLIFADTDEMTMHRKISKMTGPQTQMVTMNAPPGEEPGSRMKPPGGKPN